jgi:KaiC/GvpD/RAD55 family RecA-like ATPase
MTATQAGNVSGYAALDGLGKFLEKTGHTLLIKGYAGAGKTTLALQLLERLAGDRGVYISSRVSPDKLRRQIPWVAEALQGAKMVDVRVGLASSVFEEVVRAVTELRAPAVVLDTWDGLAKEMDEKERLKAEKTLVALADGSETRVIFVSEEPGKTTMDYLVDGIVELVRSEEYGRVFREIEVQKLRGTLIDQHKYLYTLHGGSFTHFGPYQEPDYSRLIPPAPSSDPESGYSFGAEPLDRSFGLLEHGTTVALEYTPKVPYSALRALFLPLITNFLVHGRGVVHLPLPGASPQLLVRVVSACAGRDAVMRLYRLAVAGLVGATDPPFFGFDIDQVKPANAATSAQVEAVRRASADGHVLVVDSIGLLENMYSTELNELLKALAARSSTVQRDGDLAVFLLPSDSGIKSQILSMAGVHIRVISKDRSLVVMGEKPETGAFVLAYGDNPLFPVLEVIV